MFSLFKEFAARHPALARLIQRGSLVGSLRVPRVRWPLLYQARRWFKPAVHGRSTAPSTAHPSPPILEIDTAIRGSPRLTVRGRSKPPSAAYPGRCLPEIDAAVHGSPRPADRGDRHLLTLHLGSGATACVFRFFSCFIILFYYYVSCCCINLSTRSFITKKNCVQVVGSKALFDYDSPKFLFSVPQRKLSQGLLWF